MSLKKISGCVYYRNLLPSLYLEAAGLDKCTLTSQFQIHKEVNKDTGKEDIYFEVGKIAAADVVVFTRFYGSEDFPLIKALIDAAKYYKKLIVYETDDNFFDIPKENPVYVSVIDSKEVLDYVMRNADIYTVTTKRLSKVVNRYHKKPTYVLPNCLELHRFHFKQSNKKLKKKVEGVTRIGWSGGTTHKFDLELVLPTIKKLKEEYEIEFVLMGDPDMAKLVDFDFVHIPFVPVETFPEHLKSLDLDIALCPLEDTPFNRSKSPVKWEEYSACKYSTIYSNVPPYSDYIKDGRTGLATDNTPEAWEQAIKYLIDNPQKRLSLAKRAYREVSDKFDMETQFLLWHNTYVTEKNKKDVSSSS